MTSAAFVLALVFFATPYPSEAQGPTCGLLQDCTFDNFYGDAGACSGAWKCPDPNGIGLIEGEGWPKGPSVIMTGDAPFDRTIYQRVPVTPGKGYKFSVPFAVVNIGGRGWREGDQVNRRVGIDPFGGTDPNSPNIKWSNDFFGKGRFDDDQLQVNEYARAPLITVFIRVINPYDGQHVDVFIDTPSLIENPDMPPIQAEPTATPLPPTQPPPPQPRPTRVPTVAPKATEEPTAGTDGSATPLYTPTTVQTRQQRVSTPTRNIEPTVKPSPVRTRSALVAPSARATRTRSPAVKAVPDGDGLFTLGIMGFIGLGGILAGAILAGSALVLWMRNQRRPL